MTDNRKGLKPKDRKLATTTKKNKLTSNQWQATPQQELFMDYWINPISQSFGNAYESAIRAGYSRHHALKIAAPTTNNKWIAEYKRKLDFGEEHIKQGIQDLAIRSNDSRSPDDTRLKAYETLAKIHGMIDNKNSGINLTVVQPILGGQSVKQQDKVVIDLTPDTPTP